MQVQKLKHVLSFLVCLVISTCTKLTLTKWVKIITASRVTIVAYDPHVFQNNTTRSQAIPASSMTKESALSS